MRATRSATGSTQSSADAAPTAPAEGLRLAGHRRGTQVHREGGVCNPLSHAAGAASFWGPRGQRRRPPPVAKQSRCWGSNQQDASEAPRMPGVATQVRKPPLWRDGQAHAGRAKFLYIENSSALLQRAAASEQYPCQAAANLCQQGTILRYIRLPVSVKVTRPAEASPTREVARRRRDGEGWHKDKPSVARPALYAILRLRRLVEVARPAKGSPSGSNGDDRRQWRKQGGAVGAAASRMRATAKQTLGAATRAVSPKVTEELHLLNTTAAS